MQSKKIDGLLWKQGADPESCRLELLADGAVRLVDLMFDGAANVFGKIESRSYAFGEFNFKSGFGKRPEYLETDDITSVKVAKNIESSALNRLCNLLQKDPKVHFDINLPGKSITGRVVPLQNAAIGTFFLCECEEQIDFRDKDLVIVAHLNGLSFTFRSHVLDLSGTQVALTLPKQATRFLRRYSIRADGEWKVWLGSGVDAEVKLVNFSPLGVCLEAPLNFSFDRWSEIKLKITNNHGELVETCGILIAARDGFLHMLLAGEGSGMKDRFYAFNAGAHRDFYLKEDPELAWECLDKFNYLSLSDPGVLDTLRQKCISDWKELNHTDMALQPVAMSGGSPVGTIGVVQLSPDHWLPHTLATKVDPSLIDVTAALYMAWPNYLLSLSTPIWMSTWYDANKIWHNRFYQVFIKEHSDNPDLISFVCQEYLAPQIKKIDCDEYEFKYVNSQTEKSLNEQWASHWGQHARSSALRLENKTFEFIQHNYGEIRRGQKQVGMFKVTLSSMLINPIGLLQKISICLFDRETREDQLSLTNVVKSALSFMSSNGMTRAIVLIDYDLKIDNPAELGLHYIYELRCLSAAAHLFPAMVANNELSFADMRIRKI